VRTFRSPQPLDETLAEASFTDLQTTPRSSPELPRVHPYSSTTWPQKWDTDYKKFPMSTHNETKREGGITYAAQDKLPKLPIPELSSTLKKYIAALKPLQTAREHAETQHAVEEFEKHDGLELQEKLMKYAQRKTSYIEQFCKLSTH
jgi:carnitine O-acetyltransferase